MAGYFSNHSGSRFLANAHSSHGSQTTTATTPASSVLQKNPSPVPPRSRLPSSKFSSSVSSSGDEKSQSRERESHPLKNTWVFWFRQQRAPGNKITNYEEGIKKISSAGSVESFWGLWTHLHPPSALLPTTDYLLFHAGIRRPVWEDPLNITGGKWIVRLKKGVADRLWEDLVLAVIGEQFDDYGRTGSGNGAGGNGGEEWPEICGCTISVRQNEDIVSLWNRHDGDAKVKERIRETLRRILNLPPTTVIEYKSNNDSMQDKSSFRTTNPDRTPLAPS
ncbi:eukaryotic translation initiation factor 4E [Neolentinus lepideus HHB14362 ss-1]|uniref:Eukaryotic translation initiation factor 4E n=1 Tax=Neolentinus lepideus HHB14362 ss-1 TaxID=1314782 RepID=A0A165SJI1_9AGAM|nr:eukaryotic translation initiation factor 4E [Neolentinus lepideus HHB14362 ss-1]